jgi:acetyltransferase-like isoleucine patch superfamily enzyme
MAYLTAQQLDALGLRSCGHKVLVSDKASLYNCAKISIGNNVRIDDFCILSAGVGGILVGNNVHIAAYSSLVGRGEIALQDFCNISARVSIFSSSDDYSGESLTNPTIPESYKNVHHAPVTLEKHVIVGCGSVILPGVRIGIGSAIGALSLIKADCDSFSIYTGTPASRIGTRSTRLLTLEDAYLNNTPPFPS